MRVKPVLASRTGPYKFSNFVFQIGRIIVLLWSFFVYWGVSVPVPRLWPVALGARHSWYRESKSSSAIPDYTGVVEASLDVAGGSP